MAGMASATFGTLLGRVRKAWDTETNQSQGRFSSGVGGRGRRVGGRGGFSGDTRRNPNHKPVSKGKTSSPKTALGEGSSPRAGPVNRLNLDTLPDLLSNSTLSTPLDTPSPFSPTRPPVINIQQPSSAVVKRRVKRASTFSKGSTAGSRVPVSRPKSMVMDSPRPLSSSSSTLAKSPSVAENGVFTSETDM